MANGTTSRHYILRLQLIFGAQAATLIIFSLIVFLLKTEPVVDQEFATLLLYILAGLLLVTLSAVHFIFRILVDRANAQPNLTSKLKLYTTATIIRCALLEAPGLFAAIVMLLTGNSIALLGTLLVLLLFFFFRPSRDQTIQDLNLTPQEKASLENPDTVIL
jgi:hypothetical protein